MQSDLRLRFQAACFGDVRSYGRTLLFYKRDSSETSQKLPKAGKLEPYYSSCKATHVPFGIKTRIYRMAHWIIVM